MVYFGNDLLLKDHEFDILTLKNNQIDNQIVEW